MIIHSNGGGGLLDSRFWGGPFISKGEVYGFDGGLRPI